MIRLRPANREDRDWIVAVHLDHYTRVEGFDGSFGDAVATVFDDFLSRMVSCNAAGWIAQGNAGPVGSILCMPSTASGIAQLRLFFVTGEVRGQGVGARLLSACRDFAADAGYRRLRLWTHAEHEAARALYAAHGFTRETAYAVRSYGRDLTEEVWSLPLAIENGLQ